MNDFSSIENYEEYLRTQTRRSLLDIARNIDRGRFPDRYDLVEKTLRSTPDEEFPEELISNVPDGVNQIKMGYGILLGLFFLGVPAVFFMGYSDFNKVVALFKIGVIGTLLYGLVKARDWARRFAIANAYLWFGLTCLNFFYRDPASQHFLLSRFIDIVIAVFFVYQIFVFNRDEVIEYFRQAEPANHPLESDGSHSGASR